MGAGFISVALFMVYREGTPTNALENHIHRNLYDELDWYIT